jgi:hypothetical protein
MVAHAAVRGIEIQELESEFEGDIDLRGFLGLASDVPKGYTEIRVKFIARIQQSHQRGQSGYSGRAQIGYRLGGAIRDAVSLTWPTRATTHP